MKDGGLTAVVSTSNPPPPPRVNTPGAICLPVRQWRETLTVAVNL